MRLLYRFASTIALAAACSDDNLPPTGKASNFRINANPQPGHYLSYIQGWNLSAYHTGAGDARAVFYEADHGRKFWVNGTDAEFTSNQATLNVDEGEAFTWGVKVDDSPDQAGRLPVNITVHHYGSRGFQVAEWPATVYYGTGTLYVCYVDLYYGPAHALYWRPKLQQTPEDCVNVELRAWCLDAGNGQERPFGRNSTCYL